MNAINLQKYRVPEKDYLEHVKRTLAQIPASDTTTLVILCRKLAKFSDTDDRSILLAYASENADSKQFVLDWATAIASEHFMLPSLLVNYLIASMPEEKFSELCRLPEGEIEDDDLRLAIRRYKAEIAEEVKHAV